MERKEFWQPLNGAVSLTFDDGTESQLTKAFPALDEYGLKGTLYLHPHGKDWRRRCEPWKKFAENGHEIGNHTLSHFCSENFPFIETGLESLAPADIEADILAAQERLVTVAPHQSEWTFAYPCYLSDTGRGVHKQSYIPVIARHFLCGRKSGEYGFANDPRYTDLACIWSTPAERLDGDDMIELAQRLTAEGMWLVFVFHDIDRGVLPVMEADYRKLLAFLARENESILTGTAAEIAHKVKTLQDFA